VAPHDRFCLGRRWPRSTLRYVLRAQPQHYRGLTAEVRVQHDHDTRPGRLRVRQRLDLLRAAADVLARSHRLLRCNDGSDRTDVRLSLPPLQEGHRPVQVTGLCPT
jgi:hypothetical protein